jgi:hypothetical protein
MKKITYLLFVLFLFFGITSCKKDSNPTITTQTLTLQPGPADGQDAYVYQVANNPSAADQNQNVFKELDITQWTYGGAEGTTRVYLKFTDLSKIPAGSIIASAKLTLYGLPSSIQPQGNSYYPGSPYNSSGDNRILVQRALSNWDQTSVTWNNQPHTTTESQVLLPESTNQWNYNVTDLDVTALVRNMIAEPNQNFGFGLRLQYENIYKSMLFGSSETTDPTKRPKLVVEYVK